LREVKELERLLAQRDRQLRESHQRMRELEHRFLNDLAGLSLHLFSQAQRSREPERWSQCIALVDANIEMCKLQSVGPMDKTANVTIKAAPYLLAVAHKLQCAFAGVLEIEMSMDPAVLISRERALLVGLILHEAVTNARKYAFPNGRRGRVCVAFDRIGNKLELVVSDDGVGFDSAKVKQGTGMQAMHHLARQLSGTVRYEQLSKGTELRLSFPVKPIQSRARQQGESRYRLLLEKGMATPLAHRPKTQQSAHV
jgi:two-component system, sensor histidine kinase PdtaS